MFTTVKLAVAFLLLVTLIPSVAFASLTASPDPLLFNTVYVAPQNYQGYGNLSVSGDTGYFWFKCNKIWNINNASVNGNEDLQRVHIDKDPYESYVTISVVKNDQDCGYMTVLIYKDDGDAVFEPGGEDGNPVDTVWVFVDNCG